MRSDKLGLDSDKKVDDIMAVHQSVSMIDCHRSVDQNVYKLDVYDMREMEL